MVNLVHFFIYLNKCLHFQVILFKYRNSEDIDDVTHGNINLPTRALLADETKGSFVWWSANFNIKRSLTSM